MLLTSMHVAMLFVVNPKKLLPKIAVRTVDTAIVKYYFKHKFSRSAGTFANYSIFIFQKFNYGVHYSYGHTMNMVDKFFHNYTEIHHNESNEIIEKCPRGLHTLHFFLKNRSFIHMYVICFALFFSYYNH